MPVYAYRGKSRAGVEVRGEREADNKQSLLASLRREQINPMMVKEKGKETVPLLLLMASGQAGASSRSGSVPCCSVTSALAMSPCGSS